MAQLLASTSNQPPLMRLGPFGGIDLSVTPSQINQNNSPDMLNFNIDERGTLNKRTGYERVYETSLGAGKINGLYEYRKTNGTVLFLIAHGTKLYTQSGESQPVQIYDGLANQRVIFFTMNEKCYIMDGTNYLVYDGTTVSIVVPYIPTFAISKNPLDGGTKYEDLNLLGSGFKEQFSGDGTSTVYQLSFKGLDATPVTIEVDTVTLTEGTSFTVDRVNGKITFTSAPAPSKGTNNVIITAYKTYEGWANRIKKCTFYTMFGGSNDTRVFLSGNPDMPDYVFRLGLYDPTYAPENGFYKYPEKVTGFSKQFDYLVIHRANGAHVISYELNNGEASFPSKPINDQVGTLATGSIQIIENNPVSLSKNGVYMLTASNVRDERNVQHISANVDPKLLRETNLDKAISVDFDKKYWLAVNGKVYIYDYLIEQWYLYDNVPAACFIERDGILHFGSSTDGLLYRFKDEGHLTAFDDDGEPINAYWVSKLFDFGSPEYLKVVQRLFINLKPNTHTSVDVYYRTDRRGEEFVLSTRMDKINFLTFDFSRFGFVTSDIPQEVAKKVKLKKINYLQLKFGNNQIDEGLGIMNLSIKYGFQNEVK